LQLFVEIVREAAHFFTLLFTPCPLYLDKEPRRVKKFKDLRERKKLTDEEIQWLERIQRKTWESFDNPKEKPDWCMAPSLLLEALDELNEGLGDGRLMFLDNEKMDEYWVFVERLLEKYVVKVVNPTQPDYKEEGLVSQSILLKLWWYRNESQNNRRLRIPILTPKMLDALAANITAGAKAYEEVSDFLI
jgi:hypothetical protein